MKFPDTAKDEVVYVKVGISAVDSDGAQKNVSAEIPEWDFDGVRDAARGAWNDYLSKIDITADNDTDKRIF